MDFFNGVSITYVKTYINLHDIQHCCCIYEAISVLDDRKMN